MTIESSIEIGEVHDDNLFFSADEPTEDFILRVSPALGLRIESARWSVAGTYGFDSERFATHRDLDNLQARERAMVKVDYEVDPRLTLALDGAHTTTDRAAELGVETGLSAFRGRAQRLTFGPSGRYRISPRLSAHASSSFVTEKLTDGPGMRAQFHTAGIERRLTPRDSFRLDYEQSFYAFDLESTRSKASTYVLRAGWTRDVSARTRLVLEAGPRISDGSAAPEVSASLTHRQRLGSVTISYLQTETTTIGHLGTVQTQGLHATFTYKPSRSLTAYAAPVIARSTGRDLDTRVYRIGLGARYAITSSLGLDLTYSLDSHRGAIDPLRATGEELSHSMLSVSLTARRSG